VDGRRMASGPRMANNTAQWVRENRDRFKLGMKEEYSFDLDDSHDVIAKRVDRDVELPQALADGIDQAMAEGVDHVLVVGRRRWELHWDWKRRRPPALAVGRNAVDSFKYLTFNARHQTDRPG
jgi:hypothetical protein